MNNTSQKLSDPITMVDSISHFPDELLCHILSFLNPKQAVTTSILSKRWEFLWTYLDTLEIEIKKPGSEPQFEQHVNRALHLHGGFIKRMLLVCYGREFNNDDIVKWVQTANSKKVETLHLCFGDSCHKWTLCLFRSQTLVELRLDYADITNVDIPTAPFFPSLKKLHLYRPYCTNDSLPRFISGCSILEYFHLDSDDRHKYNYSVETYYLSSATLKSVSFDCSISCFYNIEIVLNTPALEVIKTKNSPYLELLVGSSMPSLHEADISIQLSVLESSIPSLKFLMFLSNVSALRCTVRQYNTTRLDLNKLNWHAHFNNLTRLEIVDDQYALDLLRFFIEISNNLRDLTLQKRIELCFFKESSVIWEESQHVPKCLLSSLQSVSIYGYRNGGEVESMIKYILGNAKVLKRMEISIHCFGGEIDNELIVHVEEKISIFPRASAQCEISFNKSL